MSGYRQFVDVLSTITEASCESRFPTSSSGNERAPSIQPKTAAPLGSSAHSIHEGTARVGFKISATRIARERRIRIKLARLKTYRGWLADQRNYIEKLRREARDLTAWQKRGDATIARDEKADAELLRSLQSLDEEVIFWQKNHKALQLTNKQLEAQLKEKETCILLSAQVNEYYYHLDKEYHLRERDRLTKTLQALQLRLQDRQEVKEKLKSQIALEAKVFEQRLAKKSKRFVAAFMELQEKEAELAKLNEPGERENNQKDEFDEKEGDELANEDDVHQNPQPTDNTTQLLADLKNLLI